MFHTLVEDFDRSPHGADHPAPDDALRQLQMMETEQVHPLIKIKHAFGDVVEAEELRMTAIEINYGQAGFLQLKIKCLAQAGPDMQQGKKSGRVQTTAMSKPCADDVIVVGCNGLQHVQHRDRVL